MGTNDVTLPDGTVAGWVIGDLLRQWQDHNGELSERRYSLAFRAARAARSRSEAMGLIHSTLSNR